MLEESGISTAEALAMSLFNIIAEIDGLGDKTAKKLIWNARNALGMTEFTSAGEIDENTEYITTGSSELNRILGSGLYVFVFVFLCFYRILLPNVMLWFKKCFVLFWYVKEYSFLL